MIFILSQRTFLPRAINAIKKRSGILKASSSYVLTRRSAAIWRPAEFHRVRFGSSSTSIGFSVVADHALLSMPFLKNWADTTAMMFGRQSDGEDMELCFSVC